MMKQDKIKKMIDDICFIDHSSLNYKNIQISKKNYGKAFTVLDKHSTDVIVDRINNIVKILKIIKDDI
mgnify:CR=1 FL=1